jgi:wyosine [tRNA(Phe)-imidazoG37] synthetase (radical SAM superfamily)
LNKFCEGFPKDGIAAEGWSGSFFLVTETKTSMSRMDPTAEEADYFDKGRPGVSRPPAVQSAFHCPRYFPQGRSVYTVISPRAHGLAVGVNLSPDLYCNFNCVYCEVVGHKSNCPSPCDIEATATQLESVLATAYDGSLARLPCYQSVPAELLHLREVSLSGDGEPTWCPNFCETVAAVVRIRAIGKYPFFKIVLVTNGTGLQRPDVREGVRLLTSQDEIWIKLDAGTQEWLEHINRTNLQLEDIVANIIKVGRERPVVIQSLFPLFDNAPPPRPEVDAYISRLQELKDCHVQISLVQIYSAHRPTAHADCGHLPLRILSQIAREVREKTGLRAEVF